MPVRLSDDEAKMINNVSNSLYRYFKESYTLDTSENIIIFYFLILKKEGFRSDLLTDYDSTENQIQNFLYSLNPDYKKSYSEVINFYSPIVKKINKGELIEMFQSWEYFFYHIEKEFLNKFFLEIFDTILSYYSVFDESSLIPMELSRLMSNIVPLKNGAKIFNPYAGEANIAVFTGNKNVYYGQEPDAFRYIIGKMRLLSCDFSINKSLEYGNIEKAWTPYDLIIADPFSMSNTPPPNNSNTNLLKSAGVALALPIFPLLGVLSLGLGLAKTINMASVSSKKIHENLDFILKKGLTELNDNGKLILLVPDSFLYENININNRKIFVDKDFIEYVISLPSGILKHTGIKTNLLVFNKNKTSKGIVNFIDGSNFSNDQSSVNKKLNDYDLIDVIKLNQENSIFRKVTIDTIKKSDYILDFKRYFLESFKGIPLNDLLFKIQQAVNPLDKVGLLIKPKDLKQDKIDFILNNSTLEITEIEKSSRLLKESALLVSLHNKNLKPTYFEYQGTPVYLEAGIFPLKVDNKTIVIDYLINELLSDDVKCQVDGLSVGSTMPILREDDFLTIKIKMISVDQQRFVYDKLKLSILQEKAKELGLVNQLVDVKNNFYEELGVKKHNMGQYVTNIGSGISLIMKTMKKNKGILKADDVPFEATIWEIMENIKISLESLEEHVENLQNKDVFDPSIPVDLKLLLREALNNYDNKSSNVHIDYKFDIIPFESENIDEILVLCSENSIRKLLNNIFENAYKHGFRDKNKKYTILIKLFIENGKIVLQILNNGLAFPKRLSEKLGIRGEKGGETAGTGIGAWLIIEIAKNYNFDYKIIDEPDSEFPVGWEFKFNLIQ